MRNYITQEIFEEEAGHCDYYDWEFESISFKWIPKTGVWIMSGYDLNETFDGTIEGRPLTRCVCGDSQFIHYMMVNGERSPLACPICEPEPTKKPMPKMVLVRDEWDQTETAWGCGNYIHDSTCNTVRELRHFKNHPQRELYSHEYEITEEGFEAIGEDLVGCQSREQEESSTKVGEEWIENAEWCYNWRIREAKTFAVCKCMKVHLKELGA